MMGRECGRRRDRNRRGVAMLELALLLPLYMLVFFIIWTMGDIGLVSSQAQLSSRFLAWKRNPADSSAVMGLSPHIRAGTARDTDTVTLMGLDGEPARFTVRHWESGNMAAAVSFPVYGNLDRPIGKTGYAAAGNAGTNEAKYADIFNHYAGHTVSGGQTVVYGKYPVAPSAYNLHLFSAATEGDMHYAASGVVRKRNDIPWLRRHFSLVDLRLRGAAGITHYYHFVGRHTVLLGNGYQSAGPGYYAAGDDAVYRLRNPYAWRAEPAGSAGGLKQSHQLHLTPARKSLSPQF